ncbi:MAG: FKBP-type peptidyl-prolyl cis-trans isomerase [Dysgonamonadaceae bacterium]|jgi:peptidylprolyl isomerase/FKBP-type peptidyl-prolyl cis-trans isomerase FklB|nr:FKBP-type peptidyl-prolyl cis-trans isomerase [Dysgonamonadaceae bacterium]
MKLKHLLFVLFAFTALVSACNDDDNEIDTEWKEANEAKFAEIAANSGYKKLESQSNNGYIMYKVLNEGSGDKSPFFSDNVKVKYQGWFKYDWNKADTYIDENENYITNKNVFDKSLVTPASFKVSSLVDGFSTALQYMVVGDKWEIWIPWKLGYGATGYSSGSIAGYTTLVFEIELVEIVE